MKRGLSITSKRESEHLIDNIKNKYICMLKYDNKKGLTVDKRFVEKKMGKKYIDKAQMLILSKDKIITLNCYYSTLMNKRKMKNIMYTILISVVM